MLNVGAYVAFRYELGGPMDDLAKTGKPDHYSGKHGKDLIMLFQQFEYEFISVASCMILFGCKDSLW